MYQDSSQGLTYEQEDTNTAITDRPQWPFFAAGFNPLRAAKGQCHRLRQLLLPPFEPLISRTTRLHIMDHSTISPAIFYWGTPVVLVSTTNEDDTSNIGPISSAWWLGNRCVLGLEGNSQTTVNLARSKQCVLNLPDETMVSNVNALARTTGTKEVPEIKIKLGYKYEKDKFKIARLTPESAEKVTPPRIRECPVQMEAEVVGVHELMKDGPSELKGVFSAIEVRVLQTHVQERLRLAGHLDRVDPDKWKLMIMSFQKLYGLKDGEL